MMKKNLEQLFVDKDEILSYPEVTIYGNDDVAVKLSEFFKNQTRSIMINHFHTLEELLNFQAREKHVLLYCGNHNSITKELINVLRENFTKIMDGRRFICCAYEDIEFDLTDLEHTNNGRIFEKKAEYIIKIDKLIEIVHYGRSGSIYLHGLLDGHPNLIGYPAGIFYNPIYDMFLLFLKTKGKIRLDDIIEIFVPNHLISGTYDAYIKVSLVKETEQYYIDRNNVFRDQLRQLFKYYFYHYGVLTEQYIFKAVNYVYSSVFGNHKVEGENIAILNHFHLRDHKLLQKYLNFFNDSVLLVSVREPFQNFISTVKLLDRKGCLDENSVLATLGYLYLNPLMLELAKNNEMIFVQIEKINSNKYEIMKAIFENINLEFSKRCLNPTINGLVMIDDYNLTEKKFDNDLSKEYKGLFSEEKLFFDFFSTISGKFGYDFNSSDLSFLKEYNDEYIYIGELKLSKEILARRMRLLYEQRGRINNILSKITII